MKYNNVADTNIKVSNIGFGAEWMVDKTQDEVDELVTYCQDNGINLLDCWMSDPNVRTLLGNAIGDNRDKWIIQGHIGSTWQNNQYVKTRQMDKVIPAFEDLLVRLKTDYIDFGMIHYVDEVKDFEDIINGEFLEYVHQLRDEGKIRHIGLSTHNPDVAKMAARMDEIKLIMFSINPAFDMMPATEVIDDYFEKKNYAQLNGIQPERQELYDLCSNTNTTLTVMKAYAGGRLFREDESPFGVTLTPVQCLEYALTRSSVASVLVGVNNTDELSDAIGYNTASIEERDYADVLRDAPLSSYLGQCTYCGHCAPCPVDINIALTNKFYDLAKTQDTVPDSIMQHYLDMNAYASDCIECGSCHTRCPFGVDIISHMNNASKLFGK